MNPTGFNARLPIPWLSARYHGGDLHAPDLLVLHSGSTGDNVAHYLATMTDGRIASAHVAARTRDGDFVQMVPLDVVAWHAGGSVCQGRDGVNQRSIGVELPAHAGPGLVDATVALVHMLHLSVPTLRWWTCHRWIKDTKRDPVCWTDAQVAAAMRGCGLEMCP